MRDRFRTAALAAALGASTLFTSGLAGTTPAGAITHPVFCDAGDNYWYFIVTADWLRVHTQPGVNQPAIGQVPGGSVFCARAGSAYIKIVGGISWRYGYGHNGSVKLTGWVDASYLSPN